MIHHHLLPGHASRFPPGRPVDAAWAGPVLRNAFAGCRELTLFARRKEEGSPHSGAILLYVASKIDALILKPGVPAGLSSVTPASGSRKKALAFSLFNGHATCAIPSCDGILSDCLTSFGNRGRRVPAVGAQEKVHSSRSRRM